MKTLTFLCISFLGIINNDQNPSIHNLLQQWNKISLSTLKVNTASVNISQERELYQNRLEIMPEEWGEVDSTNYKSMRLLFLEQISVDFNWQGKKWAVIEVVKSGEITRLQSYLIYYQGNLANIIVYEYSRDKWIKIEKWQRSLKMAALFKKTDKVPWENGSNSGDVIVTSFKSEIPLRSVYFVQGTLAQESEIKRIISR